LPGVTVLVKGTTQGTVTNSEGNYSLPNIPDEATLVFSFVGMLTQEIVVGNQSTINVTMEADAIGIEEVVAVGYGTMKKASVTGSVATIDSKELETVAPISSVSNALAGRLPGLISRQQSGTPGRDNAALSIRGFGNALLIVDGIESEFYNLDPNEIESFTILKDASAAIYGARAGNGVILITTKRGIDSKATITVNSSYTLQSMTNYPKQVSSGQYAELSRENIINAGLSEDQRIPSTNLVLPDEPLTPNFALCEKIRSIVRRRCTWP
jgi:TonB-dependent SusC/RagA subfamily outer membrane receptor